MELFGLNGLCGSQVAGSALVECISSAGWNNTIENGDDRNMPIGRLPRMAQSYFKTVIGQLSVIKCKFSLVITFWRLLSGDYFRLIMCR